jgi:hypothetical protein
MTAQLDVDITTCGKLHGRDPICGLDSPGFDNSPA